MLIVLTLESWKWLLRLVLSRSLDIHRFSICSNFLPFQASAGKERLVQTIIQMFAKMRQNCHSRRQSIRKQRTSSACAYLSPSGGVSLINWNTFSVVFFTHDDWSSFKTWLWLKIARIFILLQNKKHELRAKFSTWGGGGWTFYLLNLQVAFRYWKRMRYCVRTYLLNWLSLSCRSNSWNRTTHISCFSQYKKNNK